MIKLRHPDCIGVLAYSPAQKYIVSADNNDKLRVWNSDRKSTRIRTGHLWDSDQKHIQEAIGHTGLIKAIRCSPDGNTFTTCGIDGTVRVWDSATKECIHILKEHTDWVICIDYSPDGKYIASGGHDKKVNIWDCQSGKCISTMTELPGTATCICFSPDGNFLAAADVNGMAILWDVKTQKVVSTFWGHSARVSRIAYSPDGKQLATCGNDKIICIRNCVLGGLITTLKDRAKDVMYSSSGCHVFSTSYERKVRVWEVGTWRCVYILDTRGYSEAIPRILSESTIYFVWLSEITLVDIPFFSLEALLTYFLSKKGFEKLSDPRLWNSIRKFF